MTDTTKDMTHAEKLRLAGIKRYGSEEAWREARAAMGRKARIHGQGGFAYLKKYDPKRLSKVSRAAAKARWAKEKQD